MSYISVCKNVIAQNNKAGWVDPSPPIRVSDTRSGKAVDRGHTVAIYDENGKEVARIISSTDGKPIIKAGAKVVIETAHPAKVLR